MNKGADGFHGFQRGRSLNDDTQYRQDSYRVFMALKERVEAEHNDATHWPKGSERYGHRGAFSTCPHGDCALIRRVERE